MDCIIPIPIFNDRLDDKFVVINKRSYFKILNICDDRETMLDIKRVIGKTNNEGEDAEILGKRMDRYDMLVRLDCLNKDLENIKSEIIKTKIFLNITE